MSVEHVLPAQLVIRDDFGESARWDALVSQFTGGGVTSRTFWPRSKRVYKGGLVPQVGDDSSTMVRRLERMLEQIGNRLRPWWLTEPRSHEHRMLYCGTGDGTKTTFILPVFGYSAQTLWMDGTVPASNTIRAASNLLTDTQAISTSTGAWTVVGASAIAVDSTQSCDQLSSILVTSAGGAANEGAKLSSKFTTDIAVGRHYVAVASIWGLSTITFRVSILWYDSGDTLLRTDSGTAVSGACNTYSWVQASTANITTAAPASTSYCKVQVTRIDASTAPWWFGCVGLAPGDLTQWFLPSVCPPVVEFTSAPANTKILKASATGYRMTKVRLDSDSQGWARRDGQVYPADFSATEDWS